MNNRNLSVSDCYKNFNINIIPVFVFGSSARIRFRSDSIIFCGVAFGEDRRILRPSRWFSAQNLLVEKGAIHKTVDALFIGRCETLYSSCSIFRIVVWHDEQCCAIFQREIVLFSSKRFVVLQLLHRFSLSSYFF